MLRTEFPPTVLTTQKDLESYILQAYEERGVVVATSDKGAVSLHEYDLQDELVIFGAGDAANIPGPYARVRIPLENGQKLHADTAAAVFGYEACRRDEPIIRGEGEISAMMFRPRHGRCAGKYIRAAAALGMERLTLYDEQVLTRGETARAVAGSALDIVGINHMQNLHRWVGRAKKKGRVIAAVPKSSGAIPLYEFQFQQGDVVLFGQEETGLPQELVDGSDVHLNIPVCRSGNGPVIGSYRTDVALTVVAFEALRQRQYRAILSDGSTGHTPPK